MSDPTITKEEWIERCASILVTRGGMEKEMAISFADACFESVDLYESPEEAADDEMSCWTDDEGGAPE